MRKRVSERTKSKFAKQRARQVMLFNTMSRTKEIVKPLHGKRVGMYACGPTVYDYPHIGNLRTYVMEDILRRVLEFNGFKVKHVMNITDVGHLVSDADTGEDKVESTARRERKTAWEVAEFYTKMFLEDAEKLNIRRPHIIPKATRHIADMIKLIQKLETKGYTYVIDDGVYFDTSKVKNYGKLARLDLKGLLPGARVELNPQKRNPHDFALWKFSPKGTRRDMEWESPWGVGFIGWHTECSAMSMKYLGETLDMHCGGIDHVPIHHPNEIAQSEAATGKRFVKYWVHCAHLIVDGRRMAKSLGNFLTLRDVIDKGYDPLALRFFYLQGHYRSQLNFTFGGLDAAQNALRSIHEFMRSLRVYEGGRSNPRVENLIKRATEDFMRSVNDDLNTPEALAVLFNFMTQVNKLMADKRMSKADARAVTAAMLSVDQVLGLNLKRALQKEEVTEEVRRMIEQRNQAREKHDYDAADAIRRRLRDEFGVILEDTPEGTKWKRINLTS